MHGKSCRIAVYFWPHSNHMLSSPGNPQSYPRYALPVRYFCNGYGYRRHFGKISKGYVVGSPGYGLWFYAICTLIFAIAKKQENFKIPLIDKQGASHIIQTIKCSRTALPYLCPPRRYSIAPGIPQFYLDPVVLIFRRYFSKGYAYRFGYSNSCRADYSGIPKRRCRNSNSSPRCGTHCQQAAGINLTCICGAYAP